MQKLTGFHLCNSTGLIDRAEKISAKIWPNQFLRLLLSSENKLMLFTVSSLTDGVTGNTSDFGSEESRFEP
jgi:hypothetical protein